MTSHNPSSAGQFPGVPNQQSQPFIPMQHHQFQTVGPGPPLPPPTVGLSPGQSQPLPFSQPMHQLPPWSNQPGHPAPSAHPMPMMYGQLNRPVPLGAPHLQQTGQPTSNNNSGFVPTSFGQPLSTTPGMPRYNSMSQVPTQAMPVGGQQWLPSASHGGVTAAPVQEPGLQPSGSTSDSPVIAPTSLQQSASDWQEHTASDGRRYYYNRRTRQSSWEKPPELMTPIERADASTAWKEFTTPEGKKYYYNKFTKQSKWSMPEELKLAREQAEKTDDPGPQPENEPDSHTSVETPVNVGETSSLGVSVSSGSSVTLPPLTTSPVPVVTVTTVTNPPLVVSASSAIPVTNSSLASDAGATTLPAAGSMSTTPPAVVVNTKTESSSVVDIPSQVLTTSAEGGPIAEEEKKDIVSNVKANTTSDEKATEDETHIYANKLEAKNAFKALLECTNVQSDWTWEQTMKEIINDKRYGALKTPGERKQAFNEYLGQRKKIEAEERRVRQKKAREEYTKMLEECKELTSSMKWRQAMSLFENDDRFKAVDKGRDREELFDTYIVDLQRKEREKAVEDLRKNISDFRKFLESCDFIKVNTQWRKIQDRLEDDERCLRLEKLDRLLTFQDYIRDLEKEEEDQKKLHKEHQRRIERKNRDAFRKLLEEHVSSGILTAKTHWLDYCSKVKDYPEYLAVAGNISGSKPKDLFEDVAEELEKQYHDDKIRIKDSLKRNDTVVQSSWLFEDFKASLTEDSDFPPVSDVNLKLLFEELVGRAKEKEEKEVKKRQRLADDFIELLYTIKEINISSTWEECKPLVEESQEYRTLAEETFARGLFEEYIAHLLEKAKEKERKREEEKAKKEKDKEDKEKRKDKEKKDKEREKERSRRDDIDNETTDIIDITVKEEKRKEKEKDRKHRKRHQNTVEEASSDKDEKEESKRSRRHGSDRKKSKKHSYTSESDGEHRHKKHKREHRDIYRKNGGEELEDGEVDEDGEIR